MTGMRSRHNTQIVKNKAVSSLEMKLLEKKEFIRRESYFFMKKAGKQVFNFIKNKFKKKQLIIVLSGPGNNGGDGFIVAKLLKNYGYKTEVYTLIDKKKYKGDSLRALYNYGDKTKRISSLRIKKKALIIDALFGIGLSRKIEGVLKKKFKQINKSNSKVISIDIPSGISSDTGKILGCAIKADYTITFHKKKLGHTMNQGKEFSGKLKVVDIGFKKKC